MGKLTKKDIDKEIGMSNLFIVLASGGYIEALKNLDGDIMAQISTARKLKKPFFMIVDSKLTQKEKRYLGEYFSKDNIIKRMEVDIVSKEAIIDVAREIKMISWEMTGERNIEIVTHGIDDDSVDNVKGDKDR